MLESKFSRRRVLQFGATGLGGLAAGAMLENPEPALGAIGKFVDWLIPPDEYGFQEQTNSRPRKNNEPTISADPRVKTDFAVAVPIDTNHTLPMLTLPDLKAHGQFSDTELSAGPYTFAGCSVVTTREGLLHGRQEYSALFVHNQQVLAVGFETHRVAVLDGAAKEWEDLISSQTPENLSVVRMPDIWPELVKTRFFKGSQGLLETIEFGNQVQAHHDYHPFYGVLASTRMPNSAELELNSENVVNTPEEALKLEKPYYITADGILVDMIHLIDKPRIALQWLMQLTYHQQFNKKHTHTSSQATVNTNYVGGSPNQVEFQVSLEEPISEQLILRMMTLFTSATEGVLQTEIVARTRNIGLAADALSKNSGFSPEDAYTNTLATHFAYQIFTEPNNKYTNLINQTITDWLSMSEEVLSPTELNKLGEKFIYLPVFDDLYKEILQRLLAASPCQPLHEPKVIHAMGFYPFNPVKAVENDLDPHFSFDPPATTKGVILTKYPNWAESLPKSGGRLRDRLFKIFSGN